jgi:hypothetical protein
MGWLEFRNLPKETRQKAGAQLMANRVIKKALERYERNFPKEPVDPMDLDILIWQLVNMCGPFREFRWARSPVESENEKDPINAGELYLDLMLNNHRLVFGFRDVEGNREVEGLFKMMIDEWADFPKAEALLMSDAIDFSKMSADEFVALVYERWPSSQFSRPKLNAIMKKWTPCIEKCIKKSSP